MNHNAPAGNRLVVRSVASALGIVLIASGAFADGLEALGNADGVLTWHLGSLAPGASARECVLFAHADSYAAVAGLIEDARNDLSGRPRTDASRDASGPNPAVSFAGSAPRDPGLAWIENAATDLALGPDGAFFWEGHRQALACARGGQLSRIDPVRIVSPVVVGQLGEVHPGHASRPEHHLLLSRTRESAELGNELPDRPVTAVVSIVRDVAGDEPLEVLVVIPMRTGRVARDPLLPGAVGRFHMNRLAEPFDVERQVRIQPGVVVRDL